MPVRPRIVEAGFVAPQNYDEALRRRDELIGKVDEIQQALSMRHDAEWREAAHGELRRAHGELRALKRWLRENDRVKESEWVLLGRAHALLLLLEDKADHAGHGDEVDALLDAIERVVPGKFLETSARFAVAKKGGT